MIDTMRELTAEELHNVSGGGFHPGPPPTFWIPPGGNWPDSVQDGLAKSDTTTTPGLPMCGATFAKACMHPPSPLLN